MRGICAVMLCVLLWCCSGEDNPSSSEESLRHKHDISGAFLFDYEWPVFFVESCVYIDGQMLPKCGLFAYGVGFGDGGIYYDNTDFSKTKIHTKKDSLHSILSYVLIRSRSPYSEYFSSESHRPITAVSPFWGIYLNEDTSFFEKENLEVKNYDNYRRWDGSLFCMQKNSPMLIEADDDGVVEFELTDAAGKHIHINYQMQVHRSKDYIVWNDEGVTLKKNNPFFTFVKDSCFYEKITLDSINESEFIPNSILKKCAAQSDVVYGSFLPLVQSPPLFGGRLNKEKSFSYDERDNPIQRKPLEYDQYIHFFSEGNRVFYYSNGNL